MSLFLSTPALFLFAARTLLIKAPSDIVFFISLVVIMFLDLFREKSRVCGFLCSAGCSCMCFFCLLLASLNTFFDISILLTCVIWFVLLISSVLDNSPCFNKEEIV